MAVVCEKLNDVAGMSLCVASVETVAGISQAWHDVCFFVHYRVNPKRVAGEVWKSTGDTNSTFEGGDCVEEG